MGFDFGARKLSGKTYEFVQDIEDFRCIQDHRLVLNKVGVNFSEIDAFKVWDKEETEEMILKLDELLQEELGTIREYPIETVLNFFKQCREKGYTPVLG